MREILFKAKRVDNGEWVEGLLWKKKYKDGNRIFISCFPDKDDNEKVYVVHLETVCQFAGLHDKNGNRIFEGDIINFGLRVCVVGYDTENGRYMLYENGRYKCDGFNVDTLSLKEVVGNRFDNPELLEQKG